MRQGTGGNVKPTILRVMAFCLVLALIGCGQDGDNGQDKVVARVNDYRMTLNDFKEQLNAELEFTADVKLTETVRKNFLEEMIRKELLIQEAKRLGLDTEPDFVRAIERYWESTLIRRLLEIKGAEIGARILVSEEEIQAQYRKLKTVHDPLPPLEKMREQLARQLKEQNKTIALQKWISDLRKNSQIEINEDLLIHKP